jgi:hypothetical protein
MATNRVSTHILVEYLLPPFLAVGTLDVGLFNLADTTPVPPTLPCGDIAPLKRRTAISRKKTLAMDGQRS